MIFKSVATLLYTIVAIVTASLGIRFISATSFFHYHAEASGVSWDAVAPGLQIVYLAVFRICGVAIITVSLCMSMMIVIPFARQQQRWSYYAIPLVSIVFWLSVLAITAYVSHVTPGTAPWFGSLVCVAMVVLAFYFSLLDLKE